MKFLIVIIILYLIFLIYDKRREKRDFQAMADELGVKPDEVIQTISNLSAKSSQPSISIEEAEKQLINGFKVAGISYYKNNIISILEMTEPEFSEYVYEFKEDYVLLVPEKNNKYDHNAIAVYMDNVKIGHVPKDLTSYVRVLLPKMRFFIGEISNGDMWDEDGNIVERNFSCRVSLENYSS